MLFFSRVCNFSTGIISDNVSSHNNARDGFNIDPQWITGFCDRSACFSITVALRATGRWNKNSVKKNKSMKNVLYNVDLWRKVPRSNTNLLNAYFVTGFCDAENSFVINITKNRKFKIGLRAARASSLALRPPVEKYEQALKLAYTKRKENIGTFLATAWFRFNN